MDEIVEVELPAEEAGPSTSGVREDAGETAEDYDNEEELVDWYISTTAGVDKGLKAVYYGDDELVYMHNLDLDDYGPDNKIWCILKKEPKKKATLLMRYNFP
ncbi:hypothetical protein CYMTET_55446 [Cymbomonas tetramitiformis]|uniref:Uncharacterized protein n=1 Tax=Cymbomonas tetramitiformis TaxID=36881 RepID=A0AAE0BD01_9CHLO|nr:hypothetical protein CYMTET_55446 [Cymbomonas tetramitiformis]